MTIGGASIQARSFFVIAVALALAAVGRARRSSGRAGATGSGRSQPTREGARIVGVPVDAS